MTDGEPQVRRKAVVRVRLFLVHLIERLFNLLLRQA